MFSTPPSKPPRANLPVIIRPETPADHAAIHALTAAAFPTSTANEPAIVAALRASSTLTFSLVAVDNDTIVGHVVFSPITITPAAAVAGSWLGLGPISEVPERQRRGIGRQLISEGIARLESMQSVHGCVLLGDPALYNRFGFMAGQGLRLEGVPPECFMSRVLDGSAYPAGEVRFHPAFDQSLTEANAKH